MFPKEVNHYANGMPGEKLAVVFLFLLCSCKTDHVPQLKQQAEQEMHEKVQTIVTQLREDCDSNLYQLARYKADSIIAARKKVKRKK